MTARIVTCLLFSLLFCSLSASVVCTGDSTLFKIDAAREPVVGSVDIPYNSSWIGGDLSATVAITDNGSEIYRGSGEGEFEWQPTTVGKHTLTYTTYINDVAQSEVYQATVYSGLKYDVVDGKAVITESAIDGDTITIPNEIDGYKVVKIADGVFNGKKEIESVIISEGILEIGEGAFAGCTSLRSVDIPESVVKVHFGAFAGCSNIKTVSIPALLKIGVAKAGLKQAKFNAGDDFSSSVLASETSADVSGVLMAYAADFSIPEKTFSDPIYGGSFQWNKEKTTFAYSGYMYMDSGRTYVFGKYFDDSVYIKIDEKVLLRDGNCYNFMTATYIPQWTGWHKVDIRVSDSTAVKGPTGAHTENSSYWGAEMGLGWRDDGVLDALPEANWKKLMDSGNGLLFRSADVVESQLTISDLFPDSYASITNVTLTGNLAQLPTIAFAGCAALETVTLAQSGATLALGGDKGWSFDEGGVLRSGKITHNESSVMNMTVQGEGRLTYRWKASSEYYNRFILDYAYLSVDGVAKGALNNFTLNGVAIGGSTEWEEVSIDVIGDGLHEIAWTFAKDEQDDESSIGEDCTWVDAIKYEPFVKVSFDIADAEGSAPALMKDVCGESVVLPTAEGFAKVKHTFVGWSDGVQTYAPGGSYQVEATDVVLTAVYEANMLSLPVVTSADVLIGGEITSESATIEISAGEGTTIYYTLDGTTPTRESLLYSGAFESDGLGLVMIKAIAIRDNYFDSDVAEFSFTRRPYSIAECLNASGLTFTLSGDSEWARVLDDEAHDGDAALRSGSISDNQKVVLETKVSGAGTISFWWKSSSEIFRDWPLDIVSFTVDGVEQSWLGGVKGWTNIVIDITGSGEHTLCWTYKKDQQGSAGDDCAWLDEVVWISALVETQTTPVAVPFAWLQEKYPSLTDAAAFEAKANEVAANGVNKVWECYVAGIDPTDATAEFVTKIEMVDGKPVITWEPDMNEGAGKTGVRTYKLLGSTDLKTWTEVADDAEANFNFFKVEVTMP